MIRTPPIFYGTMRCDYLHQLLKNDEPVLTATRDGINWSHPFAKAMKTAVEKVLEPLVQAERDHAMQDEQARLDITLRQKLDEALDELNTIALSELGDEKEPRQKSRERKNGLPASGFGFVPERACVQTGRDVNLRLLAEILLRVESGSIATVESDTHEIAVLTPEVVFKVRRSEPSIAEAHVKVSGRQVGSSGVITARLNGYKARAQVQVRSKKETFKPVMHRRHRSLFSDIRFEDRNGARQRVYVDRVNSSIVVATGAPSVKIYLDENNRLDTTLEGKVLLAELITEVVCREIAREGVERGSFLASDGSEADAIQSHFIRLQNQYAHLIHKVIVRME
jgi:hypothetical protein